MMYNVRIHMKFLKH